MRDSSIHDTLAKQNSMIELKKGRNQHRNSARDPKERALSLGEIVEEVSDNGSTQGDQS